MYTLITSHILHYISDQVKSYHEVWMSCGRASDLLMYLESNNTWCPLVLQVARYNLCLSASPSLDVRAMKPATLQGKSVNRLSGPHVSDLSCLSQNFNMSRSYPCGLRTSLKILYNPLNVPSVCLPRCQGCFSCSCEVYCCFLVPWSIFEFFAVQYLRCISQFCIFLFFPFST